MARFFRFRSSFFKSVTNIHSPIFISFGVVSTVPTASDAPAYVQDAFRKFDTEYRRQTYKKSKELSADRHDDCQNINDDDNINETESIKEFAAEQEPMPIETEKKPIQSGNKMKKYIRNSAIICIEALMIFLIFRGTN